MQPQKDKEIYLVDVLRSISEYKEYLFHKKIHIFLVTSIFTISFFFFSKLLDDTYNAKLTFIVEDENSSNAFSGISGIANSFGFDLGGGASTTFSQQNIFELLKSRELIISTLMRKVKIDDIQNLLIEHYIRIKDMREKWNSSDNNLSSLSYNEEITYIHDSISNYIWHEIIENEMDVSLQSNDANIVVLSIKSVNEEFAKNFAEILIDEMSRMYISHQTVKAVRSLNFLQNRADSVFRELEIAEVEYARSQDINQRIIKASGRLKELQLMRRVEVLNTMYLEIIKNLELSKISLLNKTPIINIIDRPVLPLLKENLFKKHAVLIGLFIGLIFSVLYFIVLKLIRDVLRLE